MGRHFDFNVLSVRMGSRQLQATAPNTGGEPDVANLGWVRPPLVYSSSIMLSFFVAHLGIAFWISSLWMVATLIPAAAVVSCVVVPREERYLENRFGQRYSSYRDSARRWL